MKIAIPRQPSDEPRSPITPQAVKRLIALGAELVVEAGTGRGAHVIDADLADAGASIVAHQGEATAGIWAEADVLVTLAPPTLVQAKTLREHAILIGMLAPLTHADLIRTLAERHVTAVSLEYVPRITRAQSMDVLSSQANLAGYKAVLLGAAHCPKMFPMMITAAGTLAPAKCFVIGAGVAGLQAIATAKRLGAVVEAFDVRAATKEQVESLGARFIDLPTAKQDDAEAGGYATEQSNEERKQEAELLAKQVTAADVVITTAAVFGKAPPLLIPAAEVAQMKPGAVIVDLAATPDASWGGRGNCELTRPGQINTTDQGVTLIGTLNLPGTVPTHASQAYANNIVSLLDDLISTEGDGDDAKPVIHIDLEDEIQRGCVITHAGHVVNAAVKEALG